MPESLSVVTERLPKSQVGMTIEVPADVVDATYDRVLSRLASRAKIEGFRPGKAPRALVEARIGPAVLREEVVETMVPEVVRQALDEKAIDPIDNPDVEVLELERGRPAKLKATISVMPEVTLAELTKLKVEPPDHTHEFTDEMVESLAQIPGLTVFPSQANFLLVKLPPGWDGVELRDYLMTRHGVFVRECGNKLGITSQFLRLVVRPDDAVTELVEGMFGYLRTLRGEPETGIVHLASRSATRSATAR